MSAQVDSVRAKIASVVVTAEPGAKVECVVDPYVHTPADRDKWSAVRGKKAIEYAGVTGDDGRVVFELELGHKSTTPVACYAERSSEAETAYKLLWFDVDESAAPTQRFSLTKAEPGPGEVAIFCRAPMSLGERQAELCEGGRILVDTTSLEATVEVVSPTGTYVELDGRKLELVDGKATFELDLREGIWATVFSAGKSGLAGMSYGDEPWPVTIEDEGGTWTGSMTLVASAATDELLTRAVAGGLRFDASDTAPARPRNVLGMFETGGILFYVGEPATLKDIDILAVVPLAKAKPRKLSPCRYEGGVVVEREVYDRTVSFHDRRTGKKLGSKTVRGEAPDCKSSVLANERPSKWTNEASYEDLLPAANAMLD